MRNWMKDADTEAALGLSEFIGFALRLDKDDVPKAHDTVKFLLEDPNDTAVLQLVQDESKLLTRLDEDGYDLVIHAVAKTLRPGMLETDKFLTLPEFDLCLQDHDLNSSLHYLADAGVDLLGAVSFRALLARNRHGATPLHLMAKHEKFRTRLSALPESVLHLKTRNGVTISGLLNSSEKPDPTILQEVGRE
jgi:hypothetical protein